jgi:hypothetical protein
MDGAKPLATRVHVRVCLGVGVSANHIRNLELVPIRSLELVPSRNLELVPIRNLELVP